MWAILLALATLPAPDPIIDRVDLIEINYVYNKQANPNHVQANFYDWRPSQGEYRIRAWRLLKTDDERRLLPGKFPERDHCTGEWVMIFTDGAGLREVRAPIMRERWTQYDIEREARADLLDHAWPGLLFERTW